MFIRIAFLILAFPLLSHGVELPAGEVPNLSVTFPEQHAELNRARRTRAIETADLLKETQNLDELDLDRLYMKELRFQKEIDRVEPTPQPAAKSGKTILFFDMNFAPSEINAAKAAAAARGDELLIFPERTEKQQIDIERTYRALIAQQAVYQKCHNSGQDCSAEARKLDQLRSDLEHLLRPIPRLGGLEVLQIFENLTTANKKISAIVFSGHSDGMGSFAGLFGFLSVEDIKAAMAGHEEILVPLKSILLWGCYSGTLYSLNDIWQKQFPNVRAFVGYRNLAPLGIRESSGELLKSYLLTEAQLLAAPNIPSRHKIFRGLRRVADLDASAAVDEAYYYYEQAATFKELYKACEAFDKSLIESYKCYNEAKPGCENPPADHRGPLRDFYNFMQKNRHCKEILEKENGFLPSVERLIRLIYVDNVKGNFKKHNEKYFSSFNDYVSGLGGTVRASDFVGSTRKQDVDHLARLNDTFINVGGRDQSFVDRPDWSSVIASQNSAMSIMLILGFNGWGLSCVPFSWIDPNAPENSSCGFGSHLIRPPGDDLLEQWTTEFYRTKVHQATANLDPSMWMLIYMEFSNLSGLKDVRKALIQGSISALDGLEKQTAIEQRRRALYQTLISETDNLTAEEHRALVLKNVEALMSRIGELINLAKADKHGSDAVEQLGGDRSMLELLRNQVTAL